jgi:hypothetical protein
VYERGKDKPLCHATVDAETWKRLAPYRWLFDGEKAFREIRIRGKVRRSFLHREAAGAVFSDGQMIKTKDGDCFNCVPYNLYIDGTRKLSTSPDGKHFPLRYENFKSFVLKHFPGSPVANFLDMADMEVYNTKKVNFSVEDDVEGESPHVFQNTLQKFLETEFSFNGKVNVVRRPKDFIDIEKALPVAATTAAAPEEVPPPTPILDPTPTEAAQVPMAIVAQLLSVLSGESLHEEIVLDNLSFAIRRRDEMHRFSYSREKSQV